MVNMTNVEVELISDVGMYLLFEKGMKDGVSYFSKSYSKPNNKYIISYDPKKRITYLDKNNSNYVLTGGFKWFDPAKFYLDKYADDS